MKWLGQPFRGLLAVFCAYCCCRATLWKVLTIRGSRVSSYIKWLIKCLSMLPRLWDICKPIKGSRRPIRYCLEWTPTWISILCNLTLSCHLLLSYPACSPSMDVKLTSLHWTMSQFLLFYYCSFMLDLLFLLVWGFQQVFLCSLGWLQTFILAVLYSAFSVLGLQAYISTSGSNFLKYFFFSSSLHLSVCVCWGVSPKSWH